ncbi:MAG: sugar nucleotide-binding protein [Pseudomonadota bacterium]|nr:sugar nucleotide-binding protein [Pseudomonadota bacterium]
MLNSNPGIELWGGVECTVNRVGDRYFSQLDRNAHATRPGDIERFAALGIRAIRYPVLWERVAPEGLDSADWSWSDERLARLRELEVMPIVGLVHHGSGPRDTSLHDPKFPGKLAAYAGAVAARYPWVSHYTPVNEPLTTARFSGLYGIWYPHGHDAATFKDILFNQCRGVVLSMRAIRRINPEARLVQTDDLGTTWSTPLLQYQAHFNNALRWLAWDLLCGRVDRKHVLWTWLVEQCGATASEILWFGRNSCPPDIVGVNHYVTSDRFLDERSEKYPERCHGGNARHRYADIEAVRALSVPTPGIRPLLLECWKRYALPIAVTEVHIDSRREDQLRWLAQIWEGAREAREAGADVRAVTVWGLLGAFDWNCLLTDCRDYYESGAFDVRGGRIRPTAIASMMQSIAAGGLPDDPVLSGTGWWQRPSRFLCEPVDLPSIQSGTRPKTGSNAAPVVITGATGTLGRAFARLCSERSLNFRLLSRAEMDITDRGSIDRALALHEPWAVINAAGYVKVDGAESDSERCFRENTLGPSLLAEVCARHRLPLVTFSSDLVFDGSQQAPYLEADDTAPLSVYGKSKAQAEKLVLDRHPGALVVRTSSFFGPWDQHNFLTAAVGALRAGLPFFAADDMTVSPTYVPDLVHHCLDLLIDRESGIWHLTNGHAITWADLAVRAADLAQVDASGLQRCGTGRLQLAAVRPSYSALGSSRSFAMPALDDAIGRYLLECAAP